MTWTRDEQTVGLPDFLKYSWPAISDQFMIQSE